MWPKRLNQGNLCGVMATVMRDGEYCVWELWTVGSHEEKCKWWCFYDLSSLLLSRSFTSLICTVLPGGALVWMRRSEGRCTADWCLLLRNCLTRLRSTHWIFCCSHGHCLSAGTKSPLRRWVSASPVIFFNMFTEALWSEIVLQVDKHLCFDKHLTCWNYVQHTQSSDWNQGSRKNMYTEYKNMYSELIDTGIGQKNQDNKEQWVGSTVIRWIKSVPTISFSIFGPHQLITTVGIILSILWWDGYFH